MNEQTIMRKPHRLVRLANPLACHDGKHFAVEIEAEDGQSFDVEIPLSEIGAIVEFLVGIANTVNPNATPKKVDLSPIYPRSLTFAESTQPDETLLVIRLGGFDLAFSLQNSQLAQVGLDFGRIAQALSASSQNPQ